MSNGDLQNKRFKHRPSKYVTAAHVSRGRRDLKSALVAQYSMIRSVNSQKLFTNFSRLIRLELNEKMPISRYWFDELL
jgi:hypothetical protein